MVKKLLLSSFLFGTFIVSSQNLHTQSNAASIENESDSTTGWTGLGVISSDNTEAQSGNFGIRVESTANNGRTLEYTFSATVGVDYTIRIWAKQGPQVSNGNNPAFANWTGFNGFSTTTIASANWVEYVFNVTATNANPLIRVYTSPYQLRFIAGNTVIIDSVSIMADGSDTEAPSAVSDLSSSNTTDSSTDLSWSASTDNVGVTNYEVFQDGVSIANTGTTTNFNVTGLAPSTGYNFTVFAEDAAGNTSTVSNTEAVNTLADSQAPSAITDLASSNTTETTTDLSWSASTDNVGVTNYEVFQDGVSIANTGTTTTFNVTGLVADTSYDFTVFAEDAQGNTSTVSNTETVNTLAGPDTEAPSAVSDLSSSNTTDTTTDLSWSASTDNVGVTNYEVFQDGVSIANTGTTTNFNVTGLAPSTGYNFTVFAEDAAGNTSTVSNTEAVNTLADSQAPSAITDLASSNTTETTTDLSWSASTDNVGVTNYEVFQDGVSIANTGTTTTFNVTGLVADTSYDFTVFAEDAQGNTSTVSNTETVNTLAGPDTEAPTAIVDLTASGTTSVGTSLSWSAATDNVGVTNYEVFQDGVSIANTGTTTSFNVTGLVADTSYDFTVFAEDAAGNTSTVSNTENITTLTGAGIVDYTSENANLNTVDWTVRDLFADQNVGIGTTDTQGYRLAVAGNVIAEGVKVELQGNWPDFVFLKDFDLMKLDEVRRYIKENGHLPNIPSAEKVKENGIDLGVMDAKLLQKIEELTLYLLAQEAEMKKMKEENAKIKSILARLDALENQGKNEEAKN
ncbi:fibronectin type III domain-containing protein [uncultured Allomuricauda sp.]|uniref:fibronectin type III domain-containing protein n=1 Tax=Flagellimonas sp. W118 TaxID=3410791 RepID=UPI00262AA049|nr:fibronectin type III domain-containing protein [uncultured Allomuricauda sp.]